MFEFLTGLEIDLHRRTAAGEAHVPAGHAAFADHFPGALLLPGTWTLELMQQVAEPLVEAVTLEAGRNVPISLAAIGVAKSEQPVPLPAHLVIRARLKSLDPVAASVDVDAFEGRRRCAVATLALRLGAPENVDRISRAPLAVAAVERAVASGAYRLSPRQWERVT